MQKHSSQSKSKLKTGFISALLLLITFSFSTLNTVAQNNETATQSTLSVVSATKINPTTVEILFSDKQRMTVDFYNDNIFRMFQDNNGGIIRDPEAKPDARILVENPRKNITSLEVKNDEHSLSIVSGKIALHFDKKTTLFRIVNLETNLVTVESVKPIVFEKNKVVLSFKENAQEYFYGGGVQNGRFSHKGKMIAIENQNSWTNGGVASPTPFYWSTNGYAIMGHTFKKGFYDFGAKEKGIVSIYHETNYLDMFFMINDGIVPLLNDFYQLTGNPILLPKFGFYQGHLNAYNRDYWKEDSVGILFEDGKHYKENQKDNGGIKESLNGELNNYQFSARAVIDRYAQHDMPLGWILPNDGYGAGYGQTSTLDSNIQNLKMFNDYATEKGVKIGLWTQSALHPKPEIEALLQRDIVKEVRDAGVRVLKTDVAWVGPGYSFGLNGIADASQIMTYYGDNARPFIISLDGWAGTQRYASIWSGDQTGGQWEYIRFHIPTYIGAGLSGQPNITSDMDGIFGGKNAIINTRDFQWKTFTPMQLNMDGWGTNEKYPHALGEPATSINRLYLKLKSELMPYAYSIAKEAVDGLPMIRAMFLAHPKASEGEYVNPYIYDKSTQYQFLYGPYFLVAPIYQNTKADEQGNDVRNNIYLPKGVWIDYFTGKKYEGGKILNDYDAPLWKLPVFVKAGAIIPMTNPHNQPKEMDFSLRTYEVYPAGNSEFVEYEDDGETEEYRADKGVSTHLTSRVDMKNNAVITALPAKGTFEGFVKDKATLFRVNVTDMPKKVSGKIGNKKIKLTEVATLADLDSGVNVYFYDPSPNMNRFATPGSEFEKEVIVKNPVLYAKLETTDITQNAVELTVEGFTFESVDDSRKTVGQLRAPIAQVSEENTEAYSIQPTWKPVANADYYEIEFNGMLYTNIRDTAFLFDGLEPETTYTLMIHSVNKGGSAGMKLEVTTKSNPLEFAIAGITGNATVRSQGGSGMQRLFDFNEGNLWHTRYDTAAVPFEFVADLKTVNTLDKFHYLPREGARNGTLLKGSVYYGIDRKNWTKVDTFAWEQNDEVKIFTFANQPVARYVKIAVDSAVGRFGSGKELYVFKVPGTESYLQGDINSDGVIDDNDLMSYTNYTGLRTVDADFEYISKGDINKNGLIDAYDISVVATQLDGGVSTRATAPLSGNIRLSYSEGETIEVQVLGEDFSAVNALSFALPYNPQEYEFIGIEPQNMKAMTNLTNDRLHSNGTKALYVTFVNVGDQKPLNGEETLMVIRFKAKKKVKFNLKPEDLILVDTFLNVK